jgi:hypothetical protein
MSGERRLEPHCSACAPSKLRHPELAKGAGSFNDFNLAVDGEISQHFGFAGHRPNDF